MATHRNLVVVTEGEYARWNGSLGYPALDRRTRWDIANADSVLVKLNGAANLYRVMKSRYTNNVGKIIRMEVL